MNLLTSESFLDYLERLFRGERIIYEPGMRILHCFSPRFCGNHYYLIVSEYNGFFEIGYEWDKNTGEFDRNDPIALSFWGIRGQLIRHTHLLGKVLPDGSLPAIELVRDAARYFRERGELTEERERKKFAKAYRFLRRERLVIPKRELDAVLSDVTRH